MSKLFYLQNVSAGYVGNCASFWRRGGCGYTTDVGDSQLFSESEADAIIRTTKGSHKWRKWPEEEIRKVALLAVDMQSLPARSHPQEGTLEGKTDDRSRN